MKERHRSELADLYDLKKEHTNRKRHENNEMRQMNHIQTKRMQSEDFYSKLMQTKLDWKKKDILLDKKTQNFKTKWHDKNLDFNQTFYSNVNSLYNKNEIVNNRQNDLK